MQNQQLGGRVYNRVYSSVCVAVQHIEEIIQAQAASTMVAASRLGGIARFSYTVKETIQSREDDKLSENIYIHCLFVKTLFLRKTCREASAACGGPVRGFIETRAVV